MKRQGQLDEALQLNRDNSLAVVALSQVGPHLLWVNRGKCGAAFGIIWRVQHGDMQQRIRGLVVSKSKKTDQAFQGFFHTPCYYPSFWGLENVMF